MSNPTELQANRDLWERGNISRKVTLDDMVEPDYRFSERRLESFRDWTKENIVPKEKLSKAGFFQTGQDDEVECYYCGMTVHSWEKGDSPHEIHKQKSPNCGHLPFIQPEDSFGSSGSPLDDEFDMSMDGNKSMLENGSEQGDLQKKSIQTEDVPVEKLHEQNRQYKEKVMCQICGLNQRDLLFMPCGHLVCCGCCFIEEGIRICPKDGQMIMGGFKVYFGN